jgi:hypothetical protein
MSKSNIKTPFKKHKNPLLNRIEKNSADRITLDEVPEPDFDMTYRNITPELIKHFTQTVRRTPEFPALINFIKHYLDVSRCSFYEDYSMENGFIIELHHHPFSLYDICEAVSQKALKEQGFIETYTVLEEVMKLHYQFLVGLCPLNPTAHDLVHNEELEIHSNIIIGEWKELYKNYFPYLSQTAIKKYDKLIESENREKVPEFPAILKLKPLTVEVKGVSQIIDEKRFDKLMIEKKMKEIDKITYQG